MRRMTYLLMVLMAFPLLAQETRKKADAGAQASFSNVVVIVVDAEESIRTEVTSSLQRAFERLPGADIVVFTSDWEDKSDWVISVTASPVQGYEDQKLFQMGFAFIEAVDVVDVRALRERTDRSSSISGRELRSQIDRSMRGVSDFRAMWMTVGLIPTDIQSRANQAAALFDKNFLGPARRRFNRRQANELRDDRYRDRDEPRRKIDD